MTSLPSEHTWRAVWDWSQKFSRETPASEPLDSDRLDELSDSVHDAVVRQDLEVLDQLHEALAPIVQVLRFASSQVPRPVRQAMRVLSLASWVRSTRHALRVDLPIVAAVQIPHGPEVLEVLTMLDPDSLTLEAVQRALPVRLSKATLSRTLARLEAAGFVARQGHTRAQRIFLLPKARRWKGERDASTSEQVRKHETKPSPMDQRAVGAMSAGAFRAKILRRGTPRPQSSSALPKAG